MSRAIFLSTLYHSLPAFPLPPSAAVHSEFA
jgi:hypothetical protein